MEWNQTKSRVFDQIYICVESICVRHKGITKLNKPRKRAYRFPSQYEKWYMQRTVVGVMSEQLWKKTQPTNTLNKHDEQYEKLNKMECTVGTYTHTQREREEVHMYHVSSQLRRCT